MRDHYKFDQQVLSSLHIRPHACTPSLKLSPRQVLGRGQYGEVFKAVHKQSKETFAIKRIIKHKVRRQHILRREMEFLLRANHPNIINVVDLIEDASRLWIVQEFCSGGELFDRIVNSQVAFFFERLSDSPLDTRSYRNCEPKPTHTLTHMYVHAYTHRLG